MNQAQRGIATLGSGLVGAGPAPQTLNDRLNRVSERLDSVASRVALALNRIEGAPTASGDSINKAIPTGRPMANVVGELEQIAEGMQRLAECLDLVA